MSQPKDGQLILSELPDFRPPYAAWNVTDENDETADDFYKIHRLKLVPVFSDVYFTYRSDYVISELQNNLPSWPWRAKAFVM